MTGKNLLMIGTAMLISILWLQVGFGFDRISQVFSMIDPWLIFLGGINLVTAIVLRRKFELAAARDGVPAEDVTILCGSSMFFKHWRNEKLFAHFGIFLRDLCLLAIANIVIFYIIRPLI